MAILLNCILKMIYRIPRPYFYDSDIEPTSCSFEYGNPSGHGMAAATFYLSICYTIISQYKIKRRILPYAGAAIFAIGVGYTRVFVGLHTMDQILTGVALGAALFMAYMTDLYKFYDGKGHWLFSAEAITYFTGTGLLIYFYNYNQ
jgi:hypothetical protein